MGIVTPAPSATHQTVVVELVVLLREACPQDLKVLVAPFDVALADDTIMQPDLLVARRRDLTERDLPTAPVLTVELLWPSTRSIDLTLKRSRLEAASCAHAYIEVAQAIGEQPMSVHEPFPVEVAPAQLVAG